MGTMETTLERKTQVLQAQGSTMRRDEQGRLHFTAKSLSSDFLPVEWLEKAAKNSVGKHLLYRHRDPRMPEHADEPIYGEVTKAEVQEIDGKHFIVSDYTVYNFHNRGAALSQVLEERNKEEKPFGISMMYHQYKNKGTGDTVAVNVLEHSATWKPACKLCVTLEEDEQMLNLQKNTGEGEPAKTDELQKALDDKTIKLEAITKQLEDKDGEIATLTAKLEDAEASVTKSNAVLEKQAKSLGELAVRMKALEDHNEFLEKKKPLIEDIFKLEGDTQLRDMYKSWSIEKLEERLEFKKSQPRAPKVEVASETAKLEEIVIDEKTLEENKAYLKELGITDEELKGVL